MGIKWGCSGWLGERCLEGDCSAAAVQRRKEEPFPNLASAWALRPFVPCRIPAPVIQESVVDLQQYLRQSVHLLRQNYAFLHKTQNRRKFGAEKWTVD